MARRRTPPRVGTRDVDLSRRHRPLIDAELYEGLVTPAHALAGKLPKGVTPGVDAWFRGRFDRRTRSTWRPYRRQAFSDRPPLPLAVSNTDDASFRRVEANIEILPSGVHHPAPTNRAFRRCAFGRQPGYVPPSRRPSVANPGRPSRVVAASTARWHASATTSAARAATRSRCVSTWPVARQNMASPSSDV